MDTIFQRSQPVARLTKQGFDMSQMTKFTSSVGQLLPVYYDFLYPDDEVDISFEMLSRLQPLETDAMLGLTEHIDVFFVPAVQILSYFEDWVTNVHDLNSHTLYNAIDHGDIPSLRLPILKDSNLYNFIISLTGVDNYQSLAENLSYGLAGVKKDEFGVADYSNLYRLLDLLGQGSCIRNFENHPEYVWETNSGLNNIFLMFFAAYQKVFYDYYALEDRTFRNTAAFNLDNVFTDFGNGGNWYEITKLRYRPWKKDFFLCAENSPYFSTNDPNSFGRDMTFVQNWLGESSSRLYFSSNGLSRFSTDISTVDEGTLYGSSLANIRSMFAVDKMLETMRRSRKTWDYQTLAMFGIKPNLGVNGRVMYLGSHSQTMQIGEVLSTASVPQGSALGQIGGRGASYDSSRKISFKAPCRGYFLAIYSAVPELDYNNVGLDRLQTYSVPEDFYIPAFDRLGQQPLFNYQVKADDIINEQGLVRGWQPRYMESKQKYDRVCGGFMYDLDYWSPSREPLPFGTNVGIDERNFYIDPCYLDKIMSVSFQAQNADVVSSKYMFARDPLLHQLSVHCFKKSTMSKFGIESL